MKENRYQDQSMHKNNINTSIQGLKVGFIFTIIFTIIYATLQIFGIILENKLYLGRWGRTIINASDYPSLFPYIVSTNFIIIGIILTLMILGIVKINKISQWLEKWVTKKNAWANVIINFIIGSMFVLGAVYTPKLLSPSISSAAPFIILRAIIFLMGFVLIFFSSVVSRLILRNTKKLPRIIMLIVLLLIGIIYIVIQNI